MPIYFAEISGHNTELNLAQVLGFFFALIMGYFVGYIWTTGSASDNEKLRWANGIPVVLPVLGVGASLIAQWGIADVGVIHGIGWASGLCLGTYQCQKKLIRDHSTTSISLSTIEQKEVTSLVSQNLFQIGMSETEKKKNNRINELKKDRYQRAFKAIDEVHDFVHTARDQAIEFYTTRQKLLADLVRTGDYISYEKRLNEASDAYLRNTLQKSISLFEALTNRHGRLWAAVRVIEPSADQSSGVKFYQTRIRIGKVNPDREASSEPIPEDIGLPRYLRDQYSKNKGIVILNKAEKRKIWHKMKNDSRQDDNSIIAGPIIIKTKCPQTDKTKREMYMIFYINSPDEDVFNQSHEPYMKCCTDTLSLFYSMVNLSSSNPQSILEHKPPK